MIAVEGLRFSYGDDSSPALAGMELSVEAGERVLISGPTGCGKSTLGWVLCGAAPGLIPGKLAGQVRVRGRSVAELSRRELSRDLGVLLQNVEDQLFTDQVADEIAFGLENFGVPESEMEGRIAAALDRVAAGRLAGRSLTNLSAGERQRVMLAALLALDQPILLLDEPLAFLDRNAQFSLLSLLSRLSRAGRTILILEHRRDIVRPAVTRELAMAGGRVCPAPTPAKRFPAIRPGPVGAKRLIFEGVSLTWRGQQRPLFADAGFSVHAGESVVLLGENGTGKTTLLSMAMGLCRPSSGQIRNCKQPVDRTSPAELARQTALIFQHPDHQLYLAGVGEEVRSQARDREAAEAELAELGLQELIGRHPRSLSMGQKRRLTIAAALARRPRLLLMDEPSVGQDDESLSRILRRLDRFVREGGGLLTATHDRRVARALAHRSLILDKGRLIQGDQEAARIFFEGNLPPQAAGSPHPAQEALIRQSNHPIPRVFPRQEGRLLTMRTASTRYGPCEGERE